MVVLSPRMDGPKGRESGEDLSSNRVGGGLFHREAWAVAGDALKRREPGLEQDLTKL